MDFVLRPWIASCSQTRERLSAHLERELRGREASRVLRHLARCPKCREVLRSLAQALDGLRSLGRGDALSAPSQPSVAPTVVDRIRRQPDGSDPP